MQPPQLLGGQSRLLPSAHGLNVGYRLYYGPVRYPSEERIALLVLLQEGNTESLPEALARGEVRLDQPAPVLDEDLDDVMQALAQLRGE